MAIKISHIYIEGGVKWYGGAEELKQHFPLNPDESRKRVPFLPGDMLQVDFIVLPLREAF